MAKFLHRDGRRTIFFSDHALDRWWERCKANQINGRQAAMNLLRKRLADAEWLHEVPSWTRLSLWHRGRAEGFLSLDEESGFVVNKNPSNDLVAVTYLDQEKAA